MAETRAWLLTKLEGLSKAASLDLARQAEPSPQFWEGWKGTKQDLQRTIEARRRAHWNSVSVMPETPPTRSVPLGNAGGITAAECNAFLRTLPRPVPAGEACE